MHAQTCGIRLRVGGNEQASGECGVWMCVYRLQNEWRPIVRCRFERWRVEFGDSGEVREKGVESNVS